MKKVKLPNGSTMRFPDEYGGAEIQSFLKSLARSMVKEEKQPIVVNVPEFPEPPKAIDYSKLLKDAVAAIPKENGDVKELAKEIKALGFKIDAQTKALTDVITMQSDVLAELVVAYREPKKIMRDSQGRLEGIE